MVTLLEAVEALRPTIRAREAEISERRGLPADLVADLKATGVFGMAFPKSWGGPELDYVEQLRVIEALAHANGAVGWCAMIGCDGGYYSAWLDDDVAREVFPLLDTVVAGLAQPAGTAIQVDGGYRVSGRWKFGSGIGHADVVVGGAMVLDAQGAMLPGDLEGMPMWRTVVLPRDAVEVIDTWHSTGLEGSGSNDYAVKDVFVPAEHAFFILGPARRPGPLYSFLNVASKLAVVPLGIARRAIEDAVELAGTKMAMPTMQRVRDEPRTHVAIGRAEALVGSARAFVYDTFGSAFEAQQAGGHPTMAQQARMKLAAHHAAQASRDAVTLLYDTMTTSSVYQPNPLDQALRDVTTICQHIVVSSRVLETAGRVLVGLDGDVTYQR